MAVLNSKIYVGNKEPYSPPNIKVESEDSEIIIYSSNSEGQIESITYANDIEPSEVCITPISETTANVNYNSNFTFLRGKHYKINDYAYYLINATTAINKVLKHEIISTGNLERLCIGDIDKNDGATGTIKYYDSLNVENNKIVAYGLHTLTITKNMSLSIIENAIKGKYVESYYKYTGNLKYYFYIPNTFNVHSMDTRNVIIDCDGFSFTFRDGSCITYSNTIGGEKFPFIIDADDYTKMRNTLIGKYIPDTNYPITAIEPQSYEISSDIKTCIFAVGCLRQEIGSGIECCVSIIGKKETYISSKFAQYSWENPEDIISLPATIGIGIMGEELAYDTFEPIVNYINKENIPSVSYSVQSVTGSQYAFELNSDGFYENTNQSSLTYAMCKIIFTGIEENLILQCINKGEANSNYGLISKLDTMLSNEFNDDPEKIFKSFEDESFINPMNIEIPIPDHDEHFIVIKYMRGNSASKLYNSLQFKVESHIVEYIDPLKIDYGTPIWFYYNNKLILKQYVEKIIRNTKTQYTIKCFSLVGILENLYHRGGIYTGQSIKYVIKDIIGNIVDEENYRVDETISNIPVYGWLPYDTARNNLHKLLFSYNISMLRDDNNASIIVFKNIDTTNIYKILPENIYINGSTEYKKSPTSIEITEHAFIAYDEGSDIVELFNNTDSGIGADHQLVLFDNAPIHTLYAEGEVTIHESHENYAIISGIGIISGKPYIHQKNIKTVSTGVNGIENTQRVREVELITLFNSQMIIDRMIAYHKHSKDVSAAIRLINEKVGNSYTFNDEFDDIIQKAVMAEMKISTSSFIKAQCKFMVGNVFNSINGLFTHVTKLTGNGTYIVPDGITKIRVVLIGGGYGGESGYAGEDGKDTTYSSGGDGGDGGDGGIGGKGGRIFSKNLNVVPGQMFSYSCGASGIGANGNESTHDVNVKTGIIGGNTTFGNLTSLSGYSSDSGFLEMLSQEKYALPSRTPGIKGGKGGKGGDCIYALSDESASYGNEANGQYGENVGLHIGGRGGSKLGSYNYYSERTGPSSSNGMPYCFAEPDYISYTININFYLYGGAGGGSGATATQNGNQGSSSFGQGQLIYHDAIAAYTTYKVTANGGNGANGSQPSSPSAKLSNQYGYGGDGGHGGSGGGGKGGIDTAGSQAQGDGIGVTVEIYRGASTSPGKGGKGGNGGNGGPGVIFIYYN